tara:strand:- start:7 stop:438 length:432 start_codon:yes stop_codon:yes gene_type:complete
MIKEFTKYGYSYAHNNTVGTTYNSTGFALTRDATNSPRSSNFPDDCYVGSIELEATGVVLGENVQIYLARDSEGLVPITSATLGGSIQSPTIRTGSSGGYSYTIGKDYHFDDSVSNTESGKIFLFARTTSGSCTFNARVNWRS